MARQVIMNALGHSTFEFDPSSAVDIAAAERRFRRLVARGFIPAERRGHANRYVAANGKRTFDPAAEETIFIPALRGG